VLVSGEGSVHHVLEVSEPKLVQKGLVLPDCSVYECVDIPVDIISIEGKGLEWDLPLLVDFGNFYVPLAGIVDHTRFQ